MHFQGISRFRLAACLIGSLAFSGCQREDSSPLPTGWWRGISVGDQAVFARRVSGGTEPESTEHHVVRVDNLSGSVLGTSSSQVGDKSNVARATTDYSQKNAWWTPPPHSVITSRTEESVVLGGRTWRCTRYLLTTRGTPSEVWLSPEFPPVYSGGVVKMTTSIGAISTTVELKEYKGQPIAPGN